MILTTKSLSILGCGWLGLPLAERFRSLGFSVKGSTTSAEKLPLLAEKGISPFLIDLSKQELPVDPRFFDSNALIINIPPGTKRGAGHEHPGQVERALLDYRKENGTVIYVSSTSVYPDLEHDFAEPDVPDRFPSGNPDLLAAEDRVKVLAGRWIILRCGGLTGYDRMLARHFAGKKDIPNGNSPVNLIHRDDVIGIIEALVSSDIRNEIFNVSAPLHPSRAEFYTFLSRKFGLEPPQFLKGDKVSGKTVSIRKLEELLSYRFIYPDPRDFFYTFR